MKTNTFKKIFAIFVSCLVCFMAVACNKGDGDKDKEPEVITPTGKYVVADGASEYKILIPTTRDANLDFAIEELIYGIYETTGYTMQTTVNYVEGQKYISVGKTELYTQNEAKIVGDGLDKCELRVLTVGDNVILTGFDGEYTAYAVYEWMERSFGFKWYTYDSAYVQKASKIDFYEFDFSEIAQMQLRNLYQWDFWVEEPIKRNRRMRTHTWAEYHFIEGHNMVEQIITPDLYYELHPEWFTSPFSHFKGQLCITNEELIVEFIARCKEIILANWGDGTNKYFQLGMGDNWDVCNCDSCKAALEVNGTHSGNYIVFANRVSREINEWVKTIDPQKTIYFTLYAYMFTEQAPVKEVDGKYVPYNDNVVPDDTIMLLYAPLGVSHTYSYSDERNEGAYTTLKKWESLTSQLVVYSYHFNRNAFFPFNDLNTMGDVFSNAIEHDYVGWIAESGTYYRFPSMQPLKNYVSAQTWWGTDKSVTELAYEFIDFYYGPIASDFKKYYADLSQWQHYQAEVLGIEVHILDDRYGTEENWPIGVVDYFENALDAMIQKLEPLKTVDPALYEQYFHRVNVEKLWTNWAYCSLYKKYFSDSEYLARVDFVEKYVTEYMVQANGTTAETIASWRK